MKQFDVKLSLIKVLVNTVIFTALLLSSQSIRAQTYCTPSYSTGCSSGDNISDVELEGESSSIVNLLTPCSPGGYTDYTSLSADMVPGETYTGYVSTTYVSDMEYVAIWIDYNENGTFEVSEKVAHFGPIGGSTPSMTYTVTPPLDATPGTKRMRVRMGYGSSYASTMDPCTSISWGEAHDYSVEILSLTACDEFEELVAGTLANDTICAGRPFTVINTGSSLAGGLVREWQSRAVGATEWETIPGATGVNYYSTGITTPMEYRCIITCTATDEELITNTAVYSISPVTECYCVPSSTSATSSYYINNFSTTEGLTNISNLESGFSTSGYGDFTEMEVVQYEEFPISFAATFGSSSTYTFGFAIWVDWNQNGTFESAERVFVSGGYSSTHSGTFTVPFGTEPGDYRMRVLSHYNNSAPSDPCPATGNIEVEDYTLVVQAMPPCDELDLVAGTLTGGEICPDEPFILVNEGTSLASGVTRVWQSRPAGTTEWTTIAGAGSVNYSSDGITEDTEYRCIITCTATDEELITNVALYTVLPITECYCEPSSTSPTSSFYIDNFSTTEGLTNISNLNSGFSTSGYGDFTEMEVSQYPDFPVSFEATFGSSSTYTFGFAIWVDWNQNGSFEPAERVFVSGGYSSTHSGTFTVPFGTDPGDYRMRVLSHYNNSAPSDPCPVTGNIEVEDYTLVVVALPPCSNDEFTFPASVDAVAANPFVCGSGINILDLSELMPIAGGITYQWQESASASGPWTNLDDEQLTPSKIVGVEGDTYYRCIISCEENAVLTSNPVFVQAVIPETPEVNDGQSCGPGSVELTGTLSTGTIFWYENEDDVAPIGEGLTFMTPELTETTVFYATGGAYPGVDTFVGTGSMTSSSAASPFYYVWGGYKHQYLILASELADIGFTAGTVIDNIGLKVTATSVSTTFNDFSIQAGFTSTSVMTAGYISGLTEVFPATDYLPAVGMNTFEFSTPLIWDGESNLVIQTCFSNENTGGTSIAVEYSTTSTTLHRYYYFDEETVSTVCGTASAATNSQRPNIYFQIPGCESDKIPVTAYIRDTPTINIVETDGTYCLFNNEFTIHTYPELPDGHTLLWSTGETTPSITVGPSAPDTKYWVEITNEWGCTNSDTLTVTLNPSPEVDLGPDVTICEGGELILDAGPDGTSYFWNTGASTREITVEEDGQFIVLVTNSYGCMSTDTINIEVDGYAPQMEGIVVDNLAPNTFKFTPHLPLYIDSYEWDFGDGSGEVSYASSPVKEYASPGTYLVTCTVTSSCATRVYSTYVSIFTDVEDNDLKNSLHIYPNPTHDYLTVELEGVGRMETIRVTNILGQVVFESGELADPKSYRVDASRLPSGTYHLNIRTDRGDVVKSFQVVK